MDTRSKIGRRWIRDVSLSMEDRTGHILISPAKDEAARALCRRLLEDDSLKSFSAIVFSSDQELTDIPADLWKRTGRQVFTFDLTKEDSISVNPLWEGDSEMIDRIVLALSGRGEEISLEDQQLFGGFIRSACSTTTVGLSLPNLYRLLERGPQFFQNGGMRSRKDMLSATEASRLYRILTERLSPFEDERIAAAFSRPEVFVPIYYHQPSLLLVKTSQTYPQLIGLVFYWILHQILIHPRVGHSGLFLYLDGLPLPPLRDLMQLTRKRVGIHYLADQTHEPNEAIFRGIILVKETKADLILDGRLTSGIRLSFLNHEKDRRGHGLG